MLIFFMVQPDCPVLLQGLKTKKNCGTNLSPVIAM